MFKENYPSKLLEDAVEAMSSLPGVGRKGALRLALHLLRQPQENVRHLSTVLARMRDEVKYCTECNMISDDTLCSFCSDRSRDHRTLCVVESVKDVMKIEATGQYHGVYHVLGGVISPIDGVGPSDIAVIPLVTRLEKLAAEVPPAQIEVIFVLRGDVDGETTAFYIYRQIARLGIKVTSVARGLGFGDNIDYTDDLTLGRSILNRQEFRP